jgi:hypothetical protein
LFSFTLLLFNSNLFMYWDNLTIRSRTMQPFRVVASLLGLAVLFSPLPAPGQSKPHTLKVDAVGKLTWSDFFQVRLLGAHE